MATDLRPVTPTEIQKQGTARVRITWGDGHASEFDALYLRSRCPCAMCVEEMTGKRRVGEAGVPSDVSIRKISLVGNYALDVDWSDGHRTGIYSFEYLRRVCHCEACASS